MANKKLSVFFTVMVIFLFSIALGCTDNKDASEEKGTSSEDVHATEVPSNVSPSSPNSTENDSVNESPSDVSSPVSIVEENNMNNSSLVSPTSTISISSPVDGDTVNYTELVSGTSTNVSGSDHLYVLVNPIETGEEWWIQPESTVSSDGSWQAHVYFGDNTNEHIGKEYRVSAIVTSEKLDPGKLNNSLEVKYRVDKDILVTRG